ncbi:MAG: glycosyltransferase family 9 protein, partial [Deltaproteobacteria bacterium]|nr:glycosyltransferase family 9 protein [Deltaproteobacteria bacterium]
DVLRNLALLQEDSNSASTPVFSDELRLFAPEKNELPEELRTILPPPGSYALMAPGSAWETKRWSTDGYRDTARHLIDRGLKVVLMGSREEIEICREVAAGLEVINLAGRGNLDMAMHLTRHARLMVCNDSMALHLASAFKIPTVVIFCATVPEFGFGPWHNRALIIEKKGLACRPCARHGSRTCPRKTRACMDQLAAAEVLAAVDRLCNEIQA